MSATNKPKISVASVVKFSQFAVLIEKISKLDDVKMTGKIEEKKKLLIKFLEFWRNEAATIKLQHPDKECDDSFFPVMRLLLPGDDRRVYGLKETKLANYLIDVMCIAKTSTDGKKLTNYRAPQHVKADGDFASVAFFVLKNRCKENVTLTIEEVNNHLDTISFNNAKGKEGQKEVNKSIMHLLVNLSALQLKWLIRIILKDLKIGIKENTILDAFHPDAYDLYNCTSSLEKVCDSLNDPTKRLHEVAIALFSPCRPMLGEKAKPNKIEQLLGGEKFYIETKYDGERFQLHKDGDKYVYFSRNGHDYTDAFGADPYSGYFTPHIHDCFDKKVKKCILDGEMCVYNANEKLLLAKGEAYDVKSLVAASRNASDDIQICFCVFDILMYNDEVITNKPLQERVEYLKKAINECEGRLQISQQEIGTKNQEVVDALNKAIDSRLEGIVVKNPQSVYKPSQRNGSGWYKVKPDYMLGLNDDLDVLIVGGYYGTGRRSGLLSHFLLAVAVEDKKQAEEGEEPSVAEPKTFYTFCKVGSGYTLKELSDFNRKLANKWQIYDRKNPPKHLQVTYEKPDVWIEPKDSYIVQIKAVEIVVTDKYKTGYTLRFPRLEKFRDDKPWFDCMTLSELNDLKSKNEGKLANRHLDLDNLDEEDLEDGEPSKKKKRTVNRTSRPIVSARFKGIDASCVEKIGEFFADKEFCVIVGNEQYDKSTLEKHIIEYGGISVQNPKPSTFCVVTSKLIHKVNSYIKNDLYDIVKVDWLVKCIAQKRFIPWTPSDMLYTKNETKKMFAERFDAYGDSYSDDLDMDTLKKIFENMKNVPINDDIHYKIAFIENKYFPDESSEFGLFRLCNVYLDLYTKVNKNGSYIENSSLELIKMKLNWHGADICNRIDDKTTHCVLDVHDISRIDEMKLINRYRDRKFHIVSSEWVRDCIEKSRIIDELPYHL